MSALVINVDDDCDKVNDILKKKQNGKSSKTKVLRKDLVGKPVHVEGSGTSRTRPP